MESLDSIKNPTPGTENDYEKDVIEKKHDLIHTENIPTFESDRQKTSIFVSKNTFASFSDACHISGRKTCDVIEPMMEAYIKIVKNKVLEEIKMCPFKAVEVNIGTLQIMQKYETRGPKPQTEEERFESSFLVFCPKAQRNLKKVYCLHNCNFGGNSQIYQKEPCKTYQSL